MMNEQKLNEIARVAFERHCGRVHAWEGAQDWVIAAMRDAVLAYAQEAEPVAWIWISKSGVLRGASINPPTDNETSLAAMDGDSIIAVWPHPPSAQAEPVSGDDGVPAYKPRFDHNGNHIGYVFTNSEAMPAIHTQRQPSGSVVGLHAAERAAIAALLDCAAQAFFVAEDAEDDGTEDNRVPKASMKKLNEAIDKLEALPDDQPGYFMGPSSKAEWALRRLIGTDARPPRAQPEPVSGADGLHSERVLIEGTAYEVHGAVACELLRLNMELLAAQQQPSGNSGELPSLKIHWHDSPEAVHRLFWEGAAIDGGTTYEELIQGGMIGGNESGDTVELTYEQEIQAMRDQQCWGFAETDTNEIHVWAAPTADTGLLVHLLAHEIGHLTGLPHPDDIQEEMRAETFGKVAALAYGMLQSRPDIAAQAQPPVSQPTVKESLTTDERAAFEWWASDAGTWIAAVERSGDGYKLAQTDSAWRVWQARAALAQQEAKQ